MYNGVKKLIILTISFLSFLFCVFALYRNILQKYYRKIAQLYYLLLVLKEKQLEGYGLGVAR
jgi:hypothetical protein